MLALEYDSRDVEKALSDLAKSMGVNVQLLVYDQMRLWCLDNIRTMGKIASPKARQLAIEKDINRIFQKSSWLGKTHACSFAAFFFGNSNKVDR